MKTILGIALVALMASGHVYAGMATPSFAYGCFPIYGDDGYTIIGWCCDSDYGLSCFDDEE